MKIQFVIRTLLQLVFFCIIFGLLPGILCAVVATIATYVADLGYSVFRNIKEKK